MTPSLRSSLRSLPGYSMKSDRELDEVVRVVLRGLRPLPYMVLCKMGAAAREGVEEQKQAFEKGGIMAVQDSWDATPGERAFTAMIDALLEENKASRNA